MPMRSTMNQITGLTPTSTYSMSYGPVQSDALDSLVTEWKNAQAAANAANEQRYKEILDLWSGVGAAGRRRIEETRLREQATATQGLISSGLGNTSITQAARRGVTADSEKRRQELEEGIAIQKAGVIERRTDEALRPDLMSDLIRAASQSSEALADMPQYDPGKRTATIQAPSAPTYSAATKWASAAANKFGRGGGGGSVSFGGGVGGGGGGGVSAATRAASYERHTGGSGSINGQPFGPGISTPRLDEAPPEEEEEAMDPTGLSVWDDFAAQVSQGDFPTPEKEKRKGRTGLFGTWIPG